MTIRPLGAVMRAVAAAQGPEKIDAIAAVRAATP